MIQHSYKKQAGGRNINRLDWNGDHYQHFDVRKYGAVGDGITDDTDAINDAVDACISNSGGIVYFPEGIYILDPDSGSGPIIPLPTVEKAHDVQPIPIMFMGAYPGVVGATYLNYFSGCPAPTSGSVIKCLATSEDGYNSIIGVPDEWTALFIRLKNLTIRQPNNPTLTSLKLDHSVWAKIDECLIDVDANNQYSIAEPTHNTGVGVKMPLQDNGAISIIEDSFISGYYTGLQVSEHTHMKGTMFFQSCKRAMHLTGYGHSFKGDRVLVQWCPTVIYVDIDEHNCFMQIDVLQTEDLTGEDWNALIYHIDDTNNRLHAKINVNQYMQTDLNYISLNCAENVDLTAI